METFSSVLPVIVLLLVGILCKKKQIISASGIEGLQSLVMNIALPTSLFLTFFHAKLSPETIAFPAVLFLFNALGYPIGRLLCNLFRKKERFLPYAMTTSEDGMLGYALVALIVGQTHMTTFALMDIGQCFAFFIVTYQILMKDLSDVKFSVRSIIKSIFTTPLLVGMLAGIVCSSTGISGLVGQLGLDPIVDNLCSFVAAPTSAAILVVVGYHINFQNLKFGRLFGAIGMRILQQGLICVASLAIFHVLGGVFASRLTTISLIGICIMPGSFLLPIYVEPDEEKEFYSSVISIYTLLTVIAFIVLMYIV